MKDAPPCCIKGKGRRVMKKNWMKCLAAILFSIIIIASLTACGSGGGGGGGSHAADNTPGDVATDLCPNDPDKTNPGICGCGVADTDSDSDGVADCNEPHFVAVGEDGAVIASKDGTDWITVNSGTGQLLKDVAAGSWIAVGSVNQSDIDGYLVKVDDAYVKSEHILGNTMAFSDITSDGAGNWAAVGTNNVSGDGIIATSPDGTTWTTKRATHAGGWEMFHDIAYGNGMWIAAGSVLRPGPVEDCVAVYSNDWTIAAPEVVKSGCVLNSVAYNGGTNWVAVGEDSTTSTTGYVFTYNGTVWSTSSSIANAALKAVASDGNGNWIAVGVNGTDGVIVKSGSPTVATTVTNVPLNNITYGSGKWVSVGNSGKVMYSTDGTTWNTAASGTTANFSGVAFK